MHRCLKCGERYEDDKVPVFEGCLECGTKFFVVVTKEEEERIDELLSKVSPEDVEKIEAEIREKTKRGDLSAKVGRILQRIEGEKEEAAEEPPKKQDVKPKFGIETVIAKKPGVFELNIEALLKGRPVIVLVQGGSYIIRLPTVFER